MSHISQYQPYGPEFKTNPFPMLAAMRRDAPICRLTAMDGVRQIWYVTRYEDVETVLLDHKRFVSDRRNTFTTEEQAALPPFSRMERLFSRNMLMVDVPDHTRLRSLINKVFTIRIVEQLRPRIQSIVDELLEGVQAKGQMDLVDEFALVLPLRVMTELLGIPSNDQARVHYWARSMVEPTANEAEPSQGEQIFAEFITYLGQLFEEQRRTPQAGLISALVQAEEQGDRLNEEELYSTVLLLIFAGYETSVKLIGTGVLALLQHPEQLASLKANPNLIRTAIEELLRYTGPFDRAKMRFAAEDIELGGQLIRRGEPVSVLLSSANRDEQQFPEPDRLEITRQNSKHLSFGAGIHYCLGAPLARLEGEIAIQTLLHRLPQLRLTIPAAALEWDLSDILYGVKHLPVAWDGIEANG